MEKKRDDDRAVLPSNDYLNEEADSDDGKEESKGVNMPRRLIILEPIILLYATSSLIQFPVFNQYLYYTIGHRYNLTSENETRFHKCEPETNKTQSNHDVVNRLQELTIMWQMYVSIASSVTSLMVTPLYSATTDRLGRKWPMVIVTGGTAVSLIINLLGMIRKWPLIIFVLSAIIQGLSGGMGTLFAAIFAYLADITDRSGRPLRIAVLEAMFGISGVITEVGVGLWLSVQPYEWPFGLAVILAIINFLYILFLVPEVRERQASNCRKFCADQLRILEIFRPSKSPNALPMTFVMIAFFVYCSQGFTYSVSQEYEMGFPFCFDSILLGIYSGISAFVIDIGLIIAAFFFTKKLHFKPLTCAMIGILSSAASKIATGLAGTRTVLFISPILGVFSMLPIPMMRAFMSLQVPKNAQGALFASIAFLEVLCSVISSSVINILYQHTVVWFPGFTFIVLAGVGSIGLIFLALAKHVDSKKAKQQRDFSNLGRTN